jgi:hypothetical protein
MGVDGNDIFIIIQTLWWNSGKSFDKQHPNHMAKL